MRGADGAEACPPHNVSSRRHTKQRKIPPARRISERTESRTSHNEIGESVSALSDDVDTINPYDIRTLIDTLNKTAKTLTATVLRHRTHQ
jgi:hypothetical protein